MKTKKIYRRKRKIKKAAERLSNTCYCCNQPKANYWLNPTRKYLKNTPKEKLKPVCKKCFQIINAMYDDDRGLTKAIECLRNAYV